VPGEESDHKLRLAGTSWTNASTSATASRWPRNISTGTTSAATTPRPMSWCWRIPGSR